METEHNQHTNQDTGWESDKDKLRHNLTWSKEQILNWLEDANKFSNKIREKDYVLRK